MIRQGTKYLTNFWGDIRKNGKYLRSPDYCQIMRRDVRGLFNVPYASGALLIRRETVLGLVTENKSSTDPDMDLCESLRKSFQFIYVDNRGVYGTYVGDRF